MAPRDPYSGPIFSSIPGLRQIGRISNQVKASLLDTPGDILLGVPGLLAAIGEFGLKEAGIVSDPNRNQPVLNRVASALDNPLLRTNQKLYEGISEFMGVPGEPKGGLEQTARILPGMLSPGIMAKLAMKGGAEVPKMVAAAAKGKPLAIGSGIGVGIDQGLRTLVGQPTFLTGDVINPELDQKRDPLEIKLNPAEQVDPLQTELKPVPPEQEFMEQELMGEAQDEAARDYISNELAFDVAAVAPLLLLGAIRPLKGSKSISALLKRGEDVGKLMGEVPKARATKRATILKQRLFDQMAPILTPAREGLPAAEYKQFEAKLVPPTTPSGLGAMIGDTIATGQFPNSKIKTIPVAPVLERLAKLSKDDRVKLDNRLLAGTALDDRKVTGKKPSFTKYASSTLRKMGGTRDPEIRALAQDIRTIMRAERDYRYEAGLLTDNEFHAWRVGHPNFVPLRVAFEEDKPLSDFINRFFPRHKGEAVSYDPPEPIKPRSQAEGAGVQAGQARAPTELIPEHITQVIRWTEFQRARRTALTTLYELPEYKEKVIKYRGVLKPGKDEQKGKITENTVRIYKDKKVHVYDVYDPSLRAALEFRPGIAIPVFNGARMLKEFWTTGPGQPFFAPVAMAFDLATALPNRPTNRAMGVLGQFAQERFGTKIPDVVYSLDPSQVLSPLTGFVRGVGSDLAFNVSRTLENSLRKNGKIYEMFGEETTEKLIEVMTNAYLNSTKRMFQQRGAGNARFLDINSKDDIVTGVQALAPAYFKQNASWNQKWRANVLVRAYVTLLENLHNGVKLELMAANRRTTKIIDGKKKIVDKPPDELDRLAFEARNVTGDTTRKGDSLWHFFPRSFVPWGRPLVYVTARHLQGMREHPIRYTSVLAGMAYGGYAYLTTLFGQNPKAMHDYVNNWTVDERSRYFPIYKDGTDEIASYINIEPQYRVIWSPFIEAMLAVSGYKAYGFGDTSATMLQAMDGALGGEWTDKQTQEVLEGAKSGFLSYVGDPTNPIVEAGLAAFGAQSGFSQRYTLRQQNLQRIVPEETSVAGSGISSRLEGVLSAFFGSAAQTALAGAYALENWLDADLGVTEALKAAGKSMFDVGIREKKTPISGLFTTQRRLSTGNTDQKILVRKQRALKDAAAFLNLERRESGTKLTYPEQLINRIPQNIIGTEAQIAAEIIGPISSYISQTYGSQLNDLRKQLDSLNTMPISRETMITLGNQIRFKIRVLNAEAITEIQRHEAALSEALGRQVTLEDLDMEELAKTPIQAPQEPIQLTPVQ